MSAFYLLAMLAGEPVVWTPVADPDPNFVAPTVKAKAIRRAASPAPARAPTPDQPRTLDGALLNLEQAVEEAKALARVAEQEADKDLRDAEAAVNAAQAQVAAAEQQAKASPEQ